MVSAQLLEKDRVKIPKKVPFFFYIQRHPTLQSAHCALVHIAVVTIYNQNLHLQFTFDLTRGKVDPPVQCHN